MDKIIFLRDYQGVKTRELWYPTGSIVSAEGIDVEGLLEMGVIEIFDDAVDPEAVVVSEPTPEPEAVPPDEDNAVMSKPKSKAKPKRKKKVKK